MNNNNQNQQNDSATTIEEILALFATLNTDAQATFMNLFRLASAIRAGRVTGDMRELVMSFLADAFDAAGKGGMRELT